MSGAVKNTYLSGLNAAGDPDYNIYYEEFGTIMREAAYFNVRYDKAFPALSAKISPTFNNNKGYIVSGFTANAYGAEFMLFNATDTVLSLDSTSGNYLRIQGVTFTQQSQHDLTVDEFFSQKGELSNPDYSNDGTVFNEKYNREFLSIKQNRMTNGLKEFTIDAPYIQSQDDANSLMAWLTSKIMKPRKAVALEIFSMPTLQLGDIVKIKFDRDGVPQISDTTDATRYVIYSIEYSRASDGPSMIVYLSEVK